MTTTTKCKLANDAPCTVLSTTKQQQYNKTVTKKKVEQLQNNNRKTKYSQVHNFQWQCIKSAQLFGDYKYARLEIYPAS